MKKILISCVECEKGSLVKLNEFYIATKVDNCYVINLEENNIKPESNWFRKKNVKFKKEMFIEVDRCNL